jgi:hypothetical protein
VKERERVSVIVAAFDIRDVECLLELHGTRACVCISNRVGGRKCA